MRDAGRRGSTLVESAIVLLLFLVLFIGVMDVGQIFFFHHFLNDRVRAGARYASVHSYDADRIRNVVVYNTAAPDPVAPGLFGLDRSMVSVDCYDPGTAAARVEVRVSAFRMHFVSPWLMRDFTPGPFRAVMPVESGGGAQ